MVSALEIVSRVVAGALDTGKVKVMEVMTPLVSIDPDEDLMNAAEIVLTKKLSCLTVVKEGIVYGVLTAQGIAERCPQYVDKALNDVLRWSLPLR